MCSSSARSLVCLALTAALVACSKAPRHTAEVDAGATATVASANPFVRSFPGTTAMIVYERGDGTLQEIFHVRNGKVRSQWTRGLRLTDSYDVADADAAYRVFSKDHRVTRFRSPAAQMFEAYRKLDPDAQARVRVSIGLVGPDLPFYAEHSPARIGDREIRGLRASCYRMTSRVLGDVSERCYWRGILVSLSCKNPLDGTDISASATRVALNEPLDDALFEVPSDFVQEASTLDDTMQQVYGELVDRMKDPRFALEHLDRHARLAP